VGLYFILPLKNDEKIGEVMKKIQISNFGDSKVLEHVDSEIPSPAPGQVLVKIAAAGVNFLDVYQREGGGVYNMSLPFTPGVEGAGVVEKLGDGVTNLRVGDKVAWPMALGSYAEYAVIPSEKLAHVPDGIDLTIAAAVALQGATAHYLVNSTFPIKPGHTALVHAAAGGTGNLLCQMILAKGGKVIATTSTDAKEKIIRDTGVTEVIRYDSASVKDEVKRITGGAGVDVVYDGVGKATFDESLASLKPRSMMVLFGAASGQVPPFELQRLNASGSLFITRPTLGHYVATKEELDLRLGEVFEMVASGKLHVRIGKSYRLQDAAQAQDDLAGRGTVGKLILEI
jgi:NADPH2:quinone reductase